MTRLGQVMARRVYVAAGIAMTLYRINPPRGAVLITTLADNDDVMQVVRGLMRDESALGPQNEYDPTASVAAGHMCSRQPVLARFRSSHRQG